MRWPLRLPVAHNLAHNRFTDNIIVHLVDARGAEGYGEGVARNYVTGERTAESLEALRRRLLPAILGPELDPDRVGEVASTLLPAREADRHPAAVCALETALMDLAGRRLGRSLAGFLGRPEPRSLVYSGVLPLAGPERTEELLATMGELGLEQVKVKLGPEGAYQRVSQARRALGPGVRLRVDANGAWSPRRAVEIINSLEPLEVEAVEQPVPKDDFAGLAWVRARVAPLVLADESLCTPRQARRLIELQAVDGFNIRLSKCGGPVRSRRILEMARQAGLVCQLGCQVGELGLLTAAGRHFAACFPELIYLEGSLTHFVVGRDVVEQRLTFGPGGRAPLLEGDGLGVSVDQEALASCRVFELSLQVAGKIVCGSANAWRKK